MGCSTPVDDARIVERSRRVAMSRAGVGEMWAVLGAQGERRGQGERRLTSRCPLVGAELVRTLVTDRHQFSFEDRVRSRRERGR